MDVPLRSMNERSDARNERSAESQSLLGEWIPEPNPLAVKPFIAVFAACIGDEFGQVVLVPFLPLMCGDFFPDAEDVGVYVGFAMSLYYITQFIVAPLWGKFSDRYGRRPVFLIFCVGTMCGLFIVGWAGSYYVLCLARITSACCCVMAVVAKSYAGENSDETNQHRAFAVIGVAGNVGALVAPLLGGYLNHPENSLGDDWDTDFWNEFPYLLPCLVGVAIDLIALFIVWKMLPESEVWKANQKQVKKERREKRQNNNVNTTKQEDIDRIELAMMKAANDSELQTVNLYCLNRFWPEHLRTRDIIIVVLTDACHMMLTVVFDSMFAVFCEASLENGGLEFSAAQTGILLSIKGFVGLGYLSIIYPVVGGRFGARTAVVWCMLTWIALLVIFPLTHSMLTSWGASFTMYVLVFIQIFRAFVQSTASMALVAIITNSVHTVALGRVYGIAQSVSSFSAAVGPFLAGALWTASVGWEWYMSNVVMYWCLAIFATGGAICSLKLPQHLNIPVGRRKQGRYGSTTAVLAQASYEGDNQL